MNIKKKLKFTDLEYSLLVPFLVFIVWFILLGYKIVNQPFIWDDLHVIRVFSFNELISSWLGNWESSGVETPSYRPIAIIFYSFLGAIFKENFVFLRFFIFFLNILLISITLFLLLKFKIKRKVVLILAVLIIFSKIFTTLVSWFTLSALTFCYLLAVLSMYYFFRWLEERRNKDYLISLIFAFLSIFTREEMYILPLINLLIFTYYQKNYFKNVIKNFSYIFPFLLISLTHIILRKIFVVDAANFEFDLWHIKFGGQEIGLGNFIKSIKASFLPMGYWSLSKIYFFQTLSFSVWTTLILACLITLIIKYKLNYFNISLLILSLFFFCLPNIAIERSFGIYFSSIVSLLLISLLITNIQEINFSSTYSYLANFFLKIVAVTIIIFGVFGGINRSSEHLKTMNHYSPYIIVYDSIFLFQYLPINKVKIPKERLKSKIEFLNNLKIFNLDDAINYKEKKLKSGVYKFKPLSF